MVRSARRVQFRSTFRYSAAAELNNHSRRIRQRNLEVVIALFNGREPVLASTRDVVFQLLTQAGSCVPSVE